MPGWTARIALREVRASWGPALCVALLTGIVVVLVAGGERARRMLLHTRAVTYETLQHADLELRFAPTHPRVAALAREVDGVAEADERLLLPGILEIAGRRPLPTLVAVLPARGAPTLERLRVLRGRLPAPEEAALAIDRSLAADTGLDVGGRATLVLGALRRDLPVVGVTLSPEHVLRPVHPEYALPLRGTIGVVAIAPAAAAGSRHAARVDSLLVRLAPGASPEAVGAALTAALPVSILETVAAADRPGHMFTEQILATFDIYLPSTAAMVVVLALVLLVLTLGRILARQRRAFGTLTALGHAPGSISWAFTLAGALPALLGVLLGAASHGAFARLIFAGYARTVGLPPPVDPGAGWVLAAVAGACVLTAALAAGLPALLLARRRPARLLGGRGWSSRKPGGWLARGAARLGEVGRLPLSVLLGLTHILRRRGVTLVAVLGLGGSFALVMAFLLVQETRRHAVEGHVRRMALDATVHFEEAVDEARLGLLAAKTAGQVEPLLSKRGVLAAGDQQVVRRILMIAPGRWVAQQRLVTGRAFTAEDPTGVLIDRWLARHHGLAVGDSLTVFPYRDAPEGTTFTVLGVLEGVTQGFAVLPLAAGSALYGLEGLAEGAHIASSLPAAELEARLWEVPGVEAGFVLATAAEQVRAIFDATALVLWWVLAMALGVAALFLGVLAGVDAADRAHDFAVLRALGWRDRRIVTVCMTEVLARGGLALLLALPLAPVLGRLLLGRLALADFPQMTLELPVWVFALVGGAVLAALPLGGLPALRAATRVTPARALRRLTGE